MSDLVTSFANAHVKRYRALADRKHRRREKAFTVEGLQPVWRAVTSGWDVDTLLIAPELLTNEAALRMVDDLRGSGGRVVAVSRDVFAHLSGRDGPNGLAAIMRGAVVGAEQFSPGGARPVVALLEAGNPGNIGTVLRSADAAGAGGLLLVGRCADPLAPSAVKASMGSVFAVPMAEIDSPEALFDWADAQGRRIVAITGGAEHGLWTAAVEPDAVLLFGSEGAGLPDEIAARCADRLAIPMEGTAESLNLATAVSVTLFELKRRRAGKERV